MANKSVDIPGVGVVVLTKRKSSTNIRMSFGKDGSIRVSIPFWLPYQAGIEFARSRTDWIAKNRPSTKPLIKDNDRIGKAHRVNFVTNPTIAKTTVRTSQLKIVVSYPNTVQFTSKDVQSAAERGAIKALKKQSDRLLPTRLESLAKQHGFSYKSVSSKRLSSRWGSCSANKHVTLNIFLMQLPWHLIDYVLLHELTHTEHLDHSSSFWAKFEEVLPGAKIIRRELKTHQTVIVPYTPDQTL